MIQRRLESESETFMNRKVQWHEGSAKYVLERMTNLFVRMLRADYQLIEEKCKTIISHYFHRDRFFYNSDWLTRMTLHVDAIKEFEGNTISETELDNAEAALWLSYVKIYRSKEGLKVKDTVNGEVLKIDFMKLQDWPPEILDRLYHIKDLMGVVNAHHQAMWHKEQKIMQDVENAFLTCEVSEYLKLIPVLRLEFAYLGKGTYREWRMAYLHTLLNNPTPFHFAPYNQELSVEKLKRNLKMELSIWQKNL